MASSTTTSGVRRALVIGINEYVEKPLRGCVGDAQAMAALLSERFGFAEENVTLLIDREAALPRVEQELQRLREQTQPEDLVFFFFAGHGSPFEQSDGTESTGSGTTLCLMDGPDREDLFDDDFGLWLDQLAAKTEHVILIMDCCHSGTITRGSDEAASLVRGTVGPTNVRRPKRQASVGRFGRATASQHVMLAACRDDQLASETWLDDAKTMTSGALSLVLRRELRAAHDGDTWRDIFERAAPQVTELATKENGKQTPVLEGRADRVLFGLAEFHPVSPVRVTERAIVNVLLNVGAMHGVTKGSVFTVYPPHTKEGTEIPPLGRVQVTQVRGTTSRARILTEVEPRAIEVGARAVSSIRDSFDAALAMENRSTRSTLQGTLTVEVMRPAADGKFAAIGDAVPEFTSGERTALRISNASTETLFVHPFYFSPRGTITLLTEGSVNPVPAGQSFLLGTQEADELVLRWTGDSTDAHFKVFATTDKLVDLSYLTRLGEVSREADELPLSGRDDWTTATRTIRLHGTATVQDDATVEVRGVTVTARGLRGTLKPVASRTQVATRGDTDMLEAALAAEGIHPSLSFELDDATLTGDGTRSAAGDATLQLQVPDAGDGVAQLAMTRDADGLVRWHLATELDSVEPTRDGTVPTLRTRTFVIPVTPAADSGERSLITTIGKKLIDVYVFPLGKAIAGAVISQFAHDLEIRRVPYRVRSFTPDDYASRDAATVIDGGGWKHLASGRALLMIHGTNSSSHSAFAELPREVVQALHAQYEGRVFAFDHPTLTHTPKENIEQLFAAMPEGLSLEVDIICHSRGGLVSRVLAERQDQILVPGRRIAVNKVIFVGSPNAGTRLCEEDFLTEYLDTFTNLLGKYPVPGTADLIAGVVMLAKIAAAGLYTSLTGIHSMQPDGLFGQWLNLGTRQPGTRYFALASNFKPTDRALLRLAQYVLAGRVFNGARNDLVVPTDGVFGANGSSAFPIADTVTFDGDDGIPHTGFFGHPRVTRQLTAWLAT